MINVLVTGGGTVAPIDEIRRISNVSSGNFSASITEAALRLGAERVRHILTPGAAEPFRRFWRVDLQDASPDLDREVAQLRARHREWIDARARYRRIALRLGTIEEYAETLEREIRDQPPDVIFLATAVSDYAPEPISGKLSSDDENLTIRAKRTPKIIRYVRDWAPRAYLVGFKLLCDVDESRLIREAEAACRANRADLTVANDWRSVAEGRHSIRLVRPGFPAETIGPPAVSEIAPALVDRVFEWSAGRHRESGVLA